MKNKKQTVTRTRKNRPQVGTVEAALVPSGSTARGLIRRIDALGKAIITGKIRPDVAKLQIALNQQALTVMGFAHKAADLQLRNATLELERAKHVSREAGRLRSAEIQVGTADAHGYAAVVRRLGGGNGKALDS
jgi:hypothetical protein